MLFTPQAFAATALGPDAQAIAAYDAAIGDNAYANSNSASGSGADTFATALGYAATAMGQSTVALGNGAQAGTAALATSPVYATAVGPNAQALAYQTTVLGANSLANQANAMAIGAQASAESISAMAFGTQASVGLGSDRSGAFGTNATVADGATDAYAIGANANATSTANMAIGSNAAATGNNTLALGFNASATSPNSIAIGNNAVTGAVQNTPSGVIGGTTYTYAGGHAIGTVSVGSASANRTITNVAAGQVTGTSTDAVNGSQLFATNTQVTANTTDITKLKQANVDAVLYDSSAHDSVTLGGVGSTKTVGLHNVAAGVVNGSSTDAVNGSQLYGVASSTASALGGGTTVNTDGSITAPQFKVDGKTFNNAGDAFSNIDGRTTSNTTNITKLQALTADAVLYDSSAHDSVTFGGVGSTTPVALHNVAPGAVSAISLDAVNGSQLFGLANSTASALGGGTTVNTDGSITAPQFKVDGKTFNNAGDAFSNIDGRMTSNTTNITKLQALTADAVMYDSSAHDSVTFGGVGSTTPVALHNVAPGAVSAISLDAVNGSQLFGLASSTASALGAGTTVNTDGSITAPQFKVDGKTFNNAGDAFSNIDGRVTNISDEINNGEIGLVKQDSVTRNITVAKANDGTTVDFTGTAGTRVLTGVSAGAVNAISVDAVNGSQLYGVASSTASALGGGTTVNADGSITAPQFKVDGKTFNNAGDAFSNIDGRTTSNTTNITKLQALTADAVMYDSSAHDSVTFGGVGSTTLVGLHNVAPGAVSGSSTDAVNGSQLFGLASSTASALGAGTTVNADGSITAPQFKVDGKTFNNAGDAFSNIDGRVTNISDEINNGEIGLVKQDSVTRNITVAKANDGTTVDFTGTAGTRVLTGVSAGAVNATSVDAVNGSQLYGVASSTASALGGGTTVNADGSITAPQFKVDGKTFNNAGDAFSNIDGRTTSNTTNITKLQALTADAVMYDSSAHDSVTLGGVGSTTLVGLHNVAAGVVNGLSTDAVNGSQLFGLASSTASALGAGTTVNADGSITAPQFKVGGQTFNNVGDAFTNLDGRVTNISDEINNGEIGLVKQDSVTRNITVAKANDGTTVDFTGTAGTRVLTGVSAGAVNANSVDAVNGSQLFALANSTASSLGGGSTVNNDGSITAPSYTVGGTTVNNVGSAISNLDGRVSQNTTDISSLQNNVTTLTGKVADAVSYDSSAHDSVTLGGAGATETVALHNVAAGTADTDAVNVGQMNDALAAITQQAATAVDPFVAANGDRSTEGAVASGTYATAVGPNAAASGNQATALGANATATASNSVALGAGSVADRDNSVSVGSAGNERQITNVAAGTAGTDAVNVNQLNAATAQSQGYVDSRIAGVQNQISDVRRDAFGAAAAAMAVAGLPQPTQAGKTMVAAGAGRIGGQTGVALGVSYVTENNKWVSKFSASSSMQGNTGVTASAGYQW